MKTLTGEARHPGSQAVQGIRRMGSHGVPDGGVALVRNRLLETLRCTAHAEHESLLASMTLVDLARDDILYAPGQPIPAVYFPVGCAASLIRIMQDGQRIEVGTTGQEGVVGVPVFLGVDASPLECVIQVPGAAYRLAASALHAAAAPGTALHGLLQRYTQYLFDQATQSLACIRMHGLGERCARWLLMTHDRVAGDHFELTQQYIAIMLGVHRPAVTLAAGALQDAGYIRYRRGKISITDRGGLQSAACECYESDRRNLERLLPTPPSRD